MEILLLLTGEEEKEPPQLDLKPLPVELKYAFLEENKQCPFVISSLLTTLQQDNLLHLLKMNKQALGWKISDLKGISPTIDSCHSRGAGINNIYILNSFYYRSQATTV